MRPTGRLAWFLFVSCVVLCALFGVTFLIDDGGEPDPVLRPANGPACSPPAGISCESAAADDLAVLTAPATWTGAAYAALRAAVPGGLCLLI